MMTWLMAVWLVAPLTQAALPTAAPMTEAQSLGRRLAAAGSLATIIPLIVEKDLGELADEDPTLKPTERDQLLAIGHAQAQAGMQRLTDALGDSYARHLSIDDLRTLVVQNESAAARHWRAIEPAAIADAVQAVGQMDLKKDTAALFCTRTGKLCTHH